MFLFLLYWGNIKLSIKKKKPTQFNVIPVFNVTSHQEATRDPWSHAASVLQKIDLPATLFIPL